MQTNPFANLDVLLEMLMASMRVVLVLSIIMIVSLWKIYEKAGKPGWANLIPFYNMIVWLEIIRKPWWWMLLMFLPILNIIFAIWATNLMSKVFGKGAGFTLGLIFLPIIFYPILAFDDSEYQPSTMDYEY